MAGLSAPIRGSSRYITGLRPWGTSVNHSATVVLTAWSPISASSRTASIDVAGADSYPQGLDVQSDGKIVLVGTQYNTDRQGWDIELMRLIGEPNLFSHDGLQAALTSGGTVTLEAATQSLASAAFAV